MAAGDSGMKDLNILIVEDNPFTAIDISKILDTLGITRKTIASDGREALQLLEQTDDPCDVIILDLRMPRMGGVEFLHRLADKDHPASVMLLSGADEDTRIAVESLARQNNIRMLGSLPKPPDPQHISNLLMQVVDAR